MNSVPIPDAAIESAGRALLTKEMGGEFDDKLHSEDLDACREDARVALEAAMTHLMPKMEWGIFRATDDDTATPVENRRYRSREIAERQIRHDFADPKYWAVRGRYIGEWAK